MRVWFLLLLLLWARPVTATDNYCYKADEYAIISGGRSPDGHWSIAAHGDGPAGYDNFDIYLMREPAHENWRLSPQVIASTRVRFQLSLSGHQIPNTWLS